MLKATFGDHAVRYLLSIFVLTSCGCGSMSWKGWQRSSTAVCDSATCGEANLSAVDSVQLDPAPAVEYPPMMEGTVLPYAEPNAIITPPMESIPAPTPDPST